MKTLNTYINEWKANKSTTTSIREENMNYFICSQQNNTKNHIKIFNPIWPLFNYYKDKVYINDEHDEVDNYGYTKNLYEPGRYKITIDEINIANSCRSMFQDSQLIEEVCFLNMPNLIDIEGMFLNCVNLKKVSLLHTKKLEKMQMAFFGCTQLTEVSKIDTHNVKYMNQSFANCENLETVPQFDTKNVENMYRMFANCTNLKHVPLFDLSSVRMITIVKMFDNCKNISDKTKNAWKQYIYF